MAPGVPGSLVGEALVRDHSEDHLVIQDRHSPEAKPHPSSGVRLTEAGYRLLEDRVHVLEAAAENLRAALEDPASRQDSVEECQRVARELSRLQSLLDEARLIGDTPSDPVVVELGDTVALRLEDGVVETYIVVDASEAPVDDQRISAGSPLGRALLDRCVGDTVEVPAPANPYRCTILSTGRADG
jgi:transcription elongation factor GreA